MSTPDLDQMLEEASASAPWTRGPLLASHVKALVGLIKERGLRTNGAVEHCGQCCLQEKLLNMDTFTDDPVWAVCAERGCPIQRSGGNGT